jgi:hypothetical protein
MIEYVCRKRTVSAFQRYLGLGVMDWVFLTKYTLAQNGWDCDFYGVLMWFENYVPCDLKLIFVTINMYFSTIAKKNWCCDKLWFLGVSIVTRRDFQRSIVIHLSLAIYYESWWYTLQTYLHMDTVQRIEKKDGILRLKVFTFSLSGSFQCIEIYDQNTQWHSFYKFQFKICS